VATKKKTEDKQARFNAHVERVRRALAILEVRADQFAKQSQGDFTWTDVATVCDFADKLCETAVSLYLNEDEDEADTAKRLDLDYK